MVENRIGNCRGIRRIRRGSIRDLRVGEGPGGMHVPEVDYLSEQPPPPATLERENPRPRPL